MAIVGLLVSGCTVGPNYVKPTLPTPDTIRGSQAPSASVALGEAKWWEVFQDSELQALVRTALIQNEDLRIAAARILQAEAQLGITRADQYPTVTVEAAAGAARSASSNSTPATTAGAVRAGGPSTGLWISGAGTAGPPNRLALSCCRPSGGSALFSPRSISDVANAYFELRALDLQLEIAQRTLASRKQSLQLTQVREAGGVTSLLDVREAEQLVFGAGATIVDLQRRITQEENFINVLLGNFPSPVTRGRELVDQQHPPEVPSGLPSSLLERRPDIQAAEQQVIAANAQIGVARAAYFPSISLTGNGGVQSSALGALFGIGAGSWSAVVTAAQPVFTAGRTRSQVAFAEARTQEATAGLLADGETARFAKRPIRSSAIPRPANSACNKKP